MPRISSTTLFNFTDKLEHLIDNLNHGFYCHNTYEKLPIKNNGYRVPMACFCDIPLSLIKEHFDWYGRYGIGIKRSFARSQGVKPVWYVTRESNLVRNLVKDKELKDYERKHLLPYLKQFMGNQLDNRLNRVRRKKFYDEREWRYIPNNSLVEPIFGLKAKREMEEAKQNGDRMNLELDKIEYIIIAKDIDFEPLLEALKEICEAAEMRFETMISKILTAKQIERDF
ncbi:abortive infection system antitoxin AbiGi family protein [uncultured Winogradskyella sp.]|uniref:abortive infection system antitoxin AbiGi family protein n=1 Tax=uncultured Winogradskyella sp. TaxID=395353 RepID=UPI003510DEEE